MPTECAHATCKNVVGKGSGLSFHRFPNDKDRAVRWTYLMHRNKDWKPKSFDRVCSAHFKREDFDLTGQTVRLRDGVEPSIFELPPHLQKASRPRHTTNSQKRPASPDVRRQASTQSSTDAVASISQNFHSYAGSDEASFKDKWLQAERRVEDLEQKLHNAVKREKRSRTNIRSLIEELKEHSLLIQDLQQQLEAYKGSSQSSDQCPTMAQDMTLLWGSDSPPCWRAMIALHEKNLQDYNHKLLSFDKMEHKSQEVLTLNPRGQLPTFRHGDIVVNESYAICFYLENRYRSQGTKLIPDGPAEQALMYQRMFEGLTFYDKLSGVISYDWFVPEAERHDSALKRNKEALTTELNLWESYLQKLGSNSYLAGAEFTLADVTVFPTVANLFQFGLPAERYPKLAEYYALLKERPSIKASWPPDWLESPGQDDLKDV